MPRRPQPTALKILKGERPDRINHDEPKPLAGEIIRPAELSPLAAEEFNRVAPHLAHMQVISAADIAGLTCYCEAVTRWRKLAAEAANAPPLLTGVEGHPIRNPIYAMVRDAGNEVLRWAKEFGLTPSARSGIHVTHHVANPADPGRLLTLPEVAGPAGE